MHNLTYIEIWTDPARGASVVAVATAGAGDTSKKGRGRHRTQPIPVSCRSRMGSTIIRNLKLWA